MPSRRTILKAGTAGGLALGTGALWTVRAGPVAVADPPADTWPQHRHDAANTARSAGSLPVNPTVAWSRQAVQRSWPSLVVGTDRVYVCGTEIAALARSDGRRQWRVDAAGSVLALGSVGSDPTLYVAHGYANDDAGRQTETLRAYDATDGTERWRHTLPMPVYGLVMTRDSLIAGCHGELVAVGHDGRRRWRRRADGLGAVYPMVHEGTLYAGLPGYVRRYRHRRLLAALLGQPPDTAWTGEDTSRAAPPTAAKGQLVMGSGQSAIDDGDPVVYGFDLAAGTREWGAGPRTDTWRGALTPVQFGHTGLTAVWTEKEDEVFGSSRVVGIDLRDGSRQFATAVDASFSSVAAGSDGAVFADSDGAIRAYHPDGRERWAVDAETGVTDVAVLDGRVFAAQEDGRVVALE
ncbi:MAG: PQQ-binding-like beta-propeller repeat protein [Haloarculaceae archaeon]